MLEYGKDECICFSGAAIEAKGSIYISLLEFNGLVSVDVETGIAKFIDCFSNECTDYQLHMQMQLYNDKVFCVPWNANNLAIYDLNNNELRYVSINAEGLPGRFTAGIQNEKYLYLISETADLIVKFDMERECVKERAAIKAACGSEPFLAFMNVRPLKFSDGIWRITEKPRCSWKYNFHNNQYDRKESVLEQDQKITAGCFGQECIWLVTNDYMIYQISMEYGIIERYDITEIMKRICQEEQEIYFDCMILNSMFLLMFEEKNCIVKIPVSLSGLDIDRWQYQQFRKAWFSFDDSGLVMMADDRIVYVNDMEEKIITPVISHDFMSAMISRKACSVRENSYGFANLKYFLRSVVEDAEEKKDASSQNMSAGEKIFRDLREIKTK